MTTLEITKSKENIEHPIIETNDIFFKIINESFVSFKNLNKIVQTDKVNLEKAQNDFLKEMMSWKKK